MDQDTVAIDPTFLSGFDNYSKTIPQSQVDSLDGVHLKDGLVYDNHFSTVQGLTYILRNDTLFYNYRIKEVHGISDSLVIKWFKKKLLLNLKFKQQKYWDLAVLQPLQNGDLILKTITTNKQEIHKFFYITLFIPLDSSSFVVNPSKKELKLLIGSDLFPPGDTLIKLNK